MQPAVPPPASSPADLVAEFEKTDGLNDRIGILRQLAIVGKAESVPLLEKLLDHEDPAIRQYALAAAESNPSPEAGAAVVAALAKAQDVGWKVAVVDAIGGRREPQAVKPLAALMLDPDERVAAAAIAALGNIRTAAAGSALAEMGAKLLRDQVPVDEEKAKWLAARVSHAMLLCAWDNRAMYRPAHYRGVPASKSGQPHLVLAGYRGMTDVGDNSKCFGGLVNFLKTGTVRQQAEAARILIDFTDEDRVFPNHPAHRPMDVRKKLLEILPTLPPTAQAFLLEALAERDVKLASKSAAS